MISNAGHIERNVFCIDLCSSSVRSLVRVVFVQNFKHLRWDYDSGQNQTYLTDMKVLPGLGLQRVTIARLVEAEALTVRTITYSQESGIILSVLARQFSIEGK